MQHAGPVAVDYDVTEADVVALHCRGVLRSPMFERAYRRHLRTGVIGGVLVAAMLAGTGYYTARTGMNPVNRAVLWAGIYVVVWSVYAFTTLRRSVFERRLRRSVEQSVRGGEVPITLGPARVELRPAEVFYSDRENKVGIEWSKVAKVEEEAGDLYITGTGGVVIRIPASAFPTDVERSEFRQEAEDLRRAAARATPAP
ncbi:MAG: hypothetical protein KF678_10095 [Phycisphaeraceae bacterium]|nr:hypothetical protein [Phycisphaeraceae bacterium]